MAKCYSSVMVAGPWEWVYFLPFRYVGNMIDYKMDCTHQSVSRKREYQRGFTTLCPDNN